MSTKYKLSIHFLHHVEHLHLSVADDSHSGVLSGYRARFSHGLEQLYKWKNHFYEIKGDVGMSLHEKGRNKKMPKPRHKVTHNPIPTSLFWFNMLFVCLFVCYECIRQSKQHNILTSNCLRNMLCCGLERNKDVGMGL